MKHYVWLGLNPSADIKNKKTAFHLPVNNDLDEISYHEINKKLNEEVLNKKSYSIYSISASENTWESLINENKYFSSIKAPTKNIDDFIKNLNNVKVNAVDVAKYILRLEKKCTSLRLQKLLFLVYSNYLRKYNAPLFDEKFYAWKYGPVNLEIYKYFEKDDMTDEIPLPNIDNLDNLNDLIVERKLNETYLKVSLFSSKIDLCLFIKKILDKYKNISVFDLIDLLHSKDSEWDKTLRNEIINDESIKN